MKQIEETRRRGKYEAKDFVGLGQKIVPPLQFPSLSLFLSLFLFNFRVSCIISTLSVMPARLFFCPVRSVRLWSWSCVRIVCVGVCGCGEAGIASWRSEMSSDQVNHQIISHHMALSLLIGGGMGRLLKYLTLYVRSSVGRKKLFLL